MRSYYASLHFNNNYKDHGMSKKHLFSLYMIKMGKSSVICLGSDVLTFFINFIEI